MLTVFWDYREGYMVKGVRINSNIYVKTLKKLKQQINGIRWGLGRGELMLLQHNTRLHTSAATSAAIESIGFEVVPHPPYSPDLVLSDFWLFRAFKTHLKGNRFTNDAEVPSCYGKMVS
jgi:histone-lysine N-methyltransferase SETMAR